MCELNLNRVRATCAGVTVRPTRIQCVGGRLISCVQDDDLLITSVQNATYLCRMSVSEAYLLPGGEVHQLGSGGMYHGLLYPTSLLEATY